MPGTVITGGGVAGNPASGYAGGASKFPLGRPTLGSGGGGAGYTGEGTAPGAEGMAFGATVGGNTAGDEVGGGATTGGVWPGQMRICSPDGSILGPRQLAQPGAATAQVATTSAQSGVRHFQRRSIRLAIHVRRSEIARPGKRRRSVKLYRLATCALPFRNRECGDFSTPKLRWCGLCHL